MLSHQNLIKFLFNRELSEMYISIALRDLALSMSGIFVPLYLLVDLEYPLSKVLLFFLIFSLSLTLSVLLAAKFTSRYGVKHGILMSMFGLILYIIFLLTLPYHNIYFIPAILSGVSTSFYWVNFHVDFARFTDKKNRSREVSLWFITSYLSVLLGPIVGSVIVTFLGFTTLFVIVSLILLLSALPLFLSSEIYEPIKFSFRYIFQKSHLKEIYFYIGYGIRMMISQVVFPLYLFFLLTKYISLGAISSLTALGSVLVGYFIGKLSKDEKREKTMLRYGSLFHSLGLFLMLFVKTFIQIAVVNVYLAMSFIFVDLPHHSMMYTRAKKQDNLMEYIVFREISIGMGRILGVLVILLTGKLVIGFILSGITMFTWFFI